MLTGTLKASSSGTHGANSFPEVHDTGQSTQMGLKSPKEPRSRAQAAPMCAAPTEHLVTVLPHPRIAPAAGTRGPGEPRRGLRDAGVGQVRQPKWGESKPFAKAPGSIEGKR